MHPSSNCCFCAAVRRQLSNHCWRSVLWMWTTRPHIDLSPTFVFCPRLMKGSSMPDCLILSADIICFQSVSQPATHITQQRQPSAACTTTWYKQSTRVILVLSSAFAWSVRRLWHQSVDHSILIEVFEMTVQVGVVLHWVADFLWSDTAGAFRQVGVR